MHPFKGAQGEGVCRLHKHWTPSISRIGTEGIPSCHSSAPTKSLNLADRRLLSFKAIFKHNELCCGVLVAGQKLRNTSQRWEWSMAFHDYFTCEALLPLLLPFRSPPAGKPPLQTLGAYGAHAITRVTRASSSCSTTQLYCKTNEPREAGHTTRRVALCVSSIWISGS